MFRKLSIVAFAAALVAAPLPVLAQSKKDSVVMAMALEPPGLDPTNAAAAAIAEVTLYNIYETLTKINEDGSVSPLLAESWTASPDLKTYTFKLRKGVKFHNGEAFDSAAVKFSFERNAAPTSTNKDKSLYQAFEKVEAPDADTIVITVKYSEPNLPFLLGQAGGSIVEPKSAPTNVTQPVGTGPYQLGAWAKGSSITLNKWADYRNASAIKLSRSASSPIRPRRWRRCCRATSMRSRASPRRAPWPSSKPIRVSRCWSAAPGPRPSSRSTIARSRWTTSASAAPSSPRSTARP
ncbi:ABC-type transport system substrate-binding protein [Bradyrhizobium sp. CIR18]|nr:ABC-type transport system substrate-binding protein [Bradyrhizobium sp. CIR18]